MIKGGRHKICNEPDRKWVWQLWILWLSQRQRRNSTAQGERVIRFVMMHIENGICIFVIWQLLYSRNKEDTPYRKSVIRFVIIINKTRMKSNTGTQSVSRFVILIANIGNECTNYRYSYTVIKDYCEFLHLDRWRRLIYLGVEICRKIYPGDNFFLWHRYPGR